MKQDETIIKVALGRDRYSIFIGCGNWGNLREHLKDVAARGVIISNPVVLSLYGEQIAEYLHDAKIEVKSMSVPEGEEYKSLQSAAHLYDELAAFGLQRSDFIMALGGGVIGDLAGFVAATYMRGVPFIQVPTTLLAQVDSSIGGKVAIDHPKGKNLIGCFYQPKLVHINVETLRTLPPRELRAGMAEVIKYAFLIGEDFLSFLEENLDEIMGLDMQLLLDVVAKCCSFKARIVEEDERDFGKRAILNYGHTIGHAIEAAAEYHDILHGEAISIGMVGAAMLSKQLGWVDELFVDRHVELFRRAGLPYKIKEIQKGSIVDRLALDKKGRYGSVRFVLLKASGEPVVQEVAPQLIEEALKALY